MFKIALILLFYDMKLTWRSAHAWITPLLFFIVTISLFSIALSNEPDILHHIAPLIIWVSLLLSILISLPNLFYHDAEEGSLDVLLLSHHPLSFLITIKIMSYWITYCFPLIIISPLLGFLLNLTPYENYALFMSLLLGTPGLSLLGAIGAALIVGIRGHGLLLPVLIMPLYIPVLLLGTGTLFAAFAHQPLNGYFALMGALTLLSLSFGPLLTSVALRVGVNQ